MNASTDQVACMRIISRLAAVGPFVAQEFMPDAIQHVAGRYPPADEARLTGILKGLEGFDTYKSRAFVYGPKIDRNTPGMWPVITFSAEHSFTNFRVRLALFFDWNQSDKFDQQFAREFGDHRAVAWRYEPPEGIAGAHCYYHAQPISSWNNNESGRLPVARPVNESHPAFPLMAHDAAGLLIAMLVSLYGHEYVKQFLGASALRKDILLVKESLSGLHLLDN